MGNKYQHNQLAIFKIAGLQLKNIFYMWVSINQNLMLYEKENTQGGVWGDTHTHSLSQTHTHSIGEHTVEAQSFKGLQVTFSPLCFQSFYTQTRVTSILPNTGLT